MGIKEQITDLFQEAIRESYQKGFEYGYERGLTEAEDLCDGDYMGGLGDRAFREFSKMLTDDVITEEAYTGFLTYCVKAARK